MPNTHDLTSDEEENRELPKENSKGNLSTEEGPKTTAKTPTAPKIIEEQAFRSPLAPETPAGSQAGEARPVERARAPSRTGARGTAAMDPKTRQEVARKGGLAVSRNKQHMAEIGRKGGQSVSKNREHMAKIGRKGGASSRAHGQGSAR